MVALHTEFLIQLAQSLGWIINREKSELVPVQTMIFLGYMFLIKEGLVRPSPERLEKLQLRLPQFLRKERIRAWEWQSIIGLLASTEKMVPLGLLHLRPLQLTLSDQWSQFRGSPHDLVTITPEVRTEIAWWLQEENLVPGVPLNRGVNPVPLVQVFTDASRTGWGGHIEGQTVQGIWSEEELDYHINVLEMLAARRTLDHFKDQLRNRSVMLSSDNSTTVSYLQRQGGTKSLTLFRMTQEMYLWLLDNRITLYCKHVPGKLNVVADQLSRAGEILPTEWSLNNRVLERIWLLWERPLVDLFATRLTTSCQCTCRQSPTRQHWQSMLYQ